MLIIHLLKLIVELAFVGSCLHDSTYSNQGKDNCNVLFTLLVTLFVQQVRIYHLMCIIKKCVCCRIHNVYFAKDA